MSASVESDITCANCDSFALQQAAKALQTHLKGLRVPFFDAYYARHLVEAVGQLVELLDTMG